MTKYLNLDSHFPTMRDEYRDGCSITELAERYHTYPNKIRRIFIKNGEPIKTKSEVASSNYAKGRSTAHMKGKKHLQSTKDKMSAGIRAAWKRKSVEELQANTERLRQRWLAMPEKDRQYLSKLATLARLNAAKVGSKLENYIIVALHDAGYTPMFHAKNFLINEALEVDILLPNDKIAIEIDGPSHFEPIWGDEKLQEQIARDSQKTGLLNNEGYKVIRLRTSKKNASKGYMKEMAERVISAVIDAEEWGEFITLEDVDYKRPRATKQEMELRKQNG